MIGKYLMLPYRTIDKRFDIRYKSRKEVRGKEIIGWYRIHKKEIVKKWYKKGMIPFGFMP